MRADLLLEHSDSLLKTSEDIVAIDAAILDLAMHGQLVPQDAEDEPASSLLERIQAEKQRLIREGELHQSRRLPIIKSSEIPYLDFIHFDVNKRTG